MTKQPILRNTQSLSSQSSHATETAKHVSFATQNALLGHSVHRIWGLKSENGNGCVPLTYHLGDVHHSKSMVPVRPCISVPATENHCLGSCNHDLPCRLFIQIGSIRSRGARNPRASLCCCGPLCNKWLTYVKNPASFNPKDMAVAQINVPK